MTLEEQNLEALYDATDQKREDESITGFTMRRLQNDVLRKAADAASGEYPSNEPGEYAEGRLDARLAVLRLLN